MIPKRAVESDEGTGLFIRRMREEDLQDVMEIEQSSFSSPWTVNMFRQDLKFPLARCFSAAVKGAGKHRLAGYIVCWLVADEVHITNVAVSGAQRRGGIGTRLVKEVLALAREHRMRYCTLEVRVSNESAKRLYHKLGFIPRGVRPKYYTDNNEDALIMTLEL